MEYVFAITFCELFTFVAFFQSGQAPDLGFEATDFVKVIVDTGATSHIVHVFNGNTTPDQKCVCLWFKVPDGITSIVIRIIFFNTGPGEVWKLDNLDICLPPPNTKKPTPSPTREPTRKPTPSPTRKPTRKPTASPTRAPTRTPVCHHILL